MTNIALNAYGSETAFEAAERASEPLTIPAAGLYRRGKF